MLRIAVPNKGSLAESSISILKEAVTPKLSIFQKRMNRTFLEPSKKEHF